MADVESIRHVAARIARAHESGTSIVAVVSAMGHTTDELLELANSLSDDPARRELDMLLSAGERISMALLSLALNGRGVPAVSFTGSQSGIITNDAHTNARIIEVRPVRVQDELARGRVVIVAGYQGVSYKREVTTLGRGGSDTTSVALAAALGAEACELYSDVDGVYSADPRLVPDAVRLSQLSYEEMGALAEAGARVLNAQAVAFAQDKGIALFARATAGSGAETIIRRDTNPDKRVLSIASRTDLALLGVGPGPGGLARLAGVVGDAGVAAQEIQMRETGHAALQVSRGDVHDFEALEATLRSELGDAFEVTRPLGSVSVVGRDVNSSLETLGTMLATLAAANVTVVGVSASGCRISLLVAASSVDETVRLLHARLVEQPGASP